MTRTEINWRAVMNIGKGVRVRVRIRRDRLFVRPEAEPLEGREFDVYPAWQFDDEHPRYPGEFALVDSLLTPKDEGIFAASGNRIVWIASGDVVPCAA